MNVYRISLLIGLLIAVLIVFMRVGHKNGPVGSGDRPSPSKQIITGIISDRPSPFKPIITGIDGESDSIILRLRQKLQQKEFVELNAILDDYQTSSESDVQTEDRLFTAYRGFGLKDLSYESLFNDWVAATPDRYQPYLARAEFYYHMGWASRGDKWASETKKEQFKKMNSYFIKAVKDVDKVFSINKQIIVPYSLLIGIATTRGEDGYMAAALNAALEISPASYKVRAHYLGVITPRWGGSVELMRTFIKESMAHVSENPKLELLKGMLWAEAGDMLALEEKYSVAEKLYTKALDYGENHMILKDRGENNYRRENYKDALSDLNRAIKLYPENGEYYYWRSKTHDRLQQYSEAVSDIIRAGALEPNDENIESQRKWLASLLMLQGYELNKNQEPTSALAKYDAALRLFPENAVLYYRKARAFVNLNRFDSAISDLKKAIKLDPDEFDYYRLLDWVLVKHKDWDQIIMYWDKFIERNPNNSHAYVERGGAYYRKGDIRAAVGNAKIAADMGNVEGRQAYEKFRHLVKQKRR